MVGMWAIMLRDHGVELVARLAQAALREHVRSCALCTWSIPVGYVAVTAGWITTEVGRQPWVVYNQLRTADAVTPNLAGHDVVDLARACTCIVYAVVFGAGAYYLVQARARGPAIAAAPPEPGPAQRPARPLSAAE